MPAFFFFFPFVIRYTTVQTSIAPLAADADLSWLSAFQCVVLTDASLALQCAVDAFCRAQQPPVMFISAAT